MADIECVVDCQNTLGERTSLVGRCTKALLGGYRKIRALVL